MNAVRYSIIVQEAAKKCGLPKPKMRRIVNAVTKKIKFYTPDDVADDINDIAEGLDVFLKSEGDSQFRDWTETEIAEHIIDIVVFQ